jgi:signal transduction histidine kinase/AraC-like DNA-binding protein
LQALVEAGLHGPRDVAVVGFDDRLEASAQEPALTTVYHPTFEMGRRAVDLLLGITDGTGDADEIVKIPTRLVVRQSCGCRPAPGSAGSVDEGPGPSAPRGDVPEANLQRRPARLVLSHHRTMHTLGLMADQLLRALDEPEIMQVLHDNLPDLRIRHAAVTFFEAEGDDPVARSLLRSTSRLDEEYRFPTRQFPPAGLYPEDEPFRLALLQLDVQKDLSGFIAFDAGNLEPLAPIERQVAATVRSARLYHAAVEGQRLAEEANRLKSRLLSTVSRELRTPLSLITGLSDLLLGDRAGDGPPLPRQVRQDVERIRAGAHHLDGLIRDVLDLSRDEVGDLALACELLDVGEILRSAGALGEQLVQAKGLAWRVEIPDDLPQVMGDRDRLRQVVLNLVSNAAKFTGEGEVALECRVRNANRGSPIANRESQIADGKSQISNPRSQMIVVSVSDTGLGIPPSEQATIFDEFRQGERTAARGYGGIGLGLAICRRLVEMHGGQIWVESSGDEGGGSAFFFTLPVPEEPPVEPEEPAEVPGRGRAVLLLAKEGKKGDEERQPLAGMGGHFAAQGFEVLEVQVGAEDDWSSQLPTEEPAVVVLDGELAAERGWELFEALRANPATRDTPVLFCALDRKGSAVLEIDHVTKPLGAADLAAALARQGFSSHEERERTVLVVDDEPGVLELHARIVQEQLGGCRVLTAENGRQALAVMQKERPDLVLLDLLMPEMDGFGVLDAMQEREALRHVPVIVLTGQTLAEEDMSRLNRGVSAVLGKGLFTVEETLAHVEGALARKAGLAPDVRQIVRRALAYVHEHYTEPISREDLAAHVGLSPRHLNRCFRQEMGVTPVTYLNRYRVNKARELLESTDETVMNVAVAVGFSSDRRLRRAFRLETGVSPDEYRKSHR